MPPKRHGGLRRPAARPALRRPAAAGVEPPDNADGGKEKPMRALSLQELQQMGTVHIKEARYYGRVVQVAGRMRGAFIEDGEMYAETQVTGTKDDELLQVPSGAPNRRLNVHVMERLVTACSRTLCWCMGRPWRR